MSPRKAGVVTVDLDGQRVEIGFNNAAAGEIVRFLFADVVVEPGQLPVLGRYDVVAAGPQPMLSLWDGEKRLYFGQSARRLAYLLMNEVVHKFITGNRRSLAMHAGAVHGRGCGLLLPGGSGSGKSSLAAWLLGQGFSYLSDELALLDGDGRILGLPRPLSFKEETHLPWLDWCGKARAGLRDEAGVMLPHRLLNPDYQAARPILTHLLFPVFQAGCLPRLIPLTPGQSMARLLAMLLNGGNFEGKGIARLATLVRRCASFRLEFASFDGLAVLLREQIPALANNLDP